MNKKENTKDELLIENHDLKRLFRRSAKQQCELGGVGYYRKFPTHIFETLVLERRRLENGYG